MKDVKSVVAQLLKEGAELRKDCTIQNVNLKSMDKYDRASLTLDKAVPSMVDDGTGKYVDGESNIVFVSVFSIAAVLGSMEQTAFAKNLIVSNSNILTLLLSFAKCDIIVEKVAAGQEYINPFSNNATPVIVKNDGYFVHIVAIKLGNIGIETIGTIKKEYVANMLKSALAGATADAISGTNSTEMPY